jgi:hypothetical protein
MAIPLADPYGRLQSGTEEDAMNLQQEVEKIVDEARRRASARITLDTDANEALRITLDAMVDALLEGLQFLARRLEALEEGSN